MNGLVTCSFCRLVNVTVVLSSWWRHQMETFSALLAICAGNSPVPGEFRAQRPVTRSFDVFFDLRLNKRLSKQSWGWWFETLSRPLWRHRNVNCYHIKASISAGKNVMVSTETIIINFLHSLYNLYSWWRHQMEKVSALLALCGGNWPVTGEFSSQRPVTRCFDVFFSPE